MTSPEQRGRAVHYLDHAATTPLRDVAVEAYRAAAADGGNPSSLHGSGRRARRRLEEARESMAARLGCRPSDLVFTSGGTEADNLAVLGQVAARRGGTVAVGATEHHSVLDAVAELGRRDDVDVRVLGVDREGDVDPRAVEAVVAEAGDRFALLAVMLANNETGTVADVPTLAALARVAGAAVHTDAVQAVGHVPVDFAALGVTSMSLSAHKFGGPVGVGALVLDRVSPCRPIGFGGGQERDLRSGTVDVPGVAAMAAALAEAEDERDAEALRLGALRRRLVDGIRRHVPDVAVNGRAPGSGPVLPGIVDLTFPGCSGESLILLLDAAGVECSTGSACTAGVAEPSHVVLAMGAGEAAARSCLRFSLGRTTGEADVEAAIAAIGPAVERARLAGAGTIAGGLTAGRHGAAPESSTDEVAAR